MKVAAAVLTYQAISSSRLGMLHSTVMSLGEADFVQVVDNGSSDGTADLIKKWGGITHSKAIHTSGHGTNMQARILAGTDADIYVFSDDDMLWRDGWRDRLEEWWADAPDDLAITGCHLEPEFPWNEIVGTIRCGNIPGLLRTSTGAASWSVPARMHDAVFGPSGVPQQRQGWSDVPACDRVRDRGFRLAQIDLADHAGQGRSSWANRTHELYGWDLDTVRKILGAVA